MNDTPVLLPIIAANLARLRRESDDLSQEQLARRAGVSVSVVTRLEQERGGATLSNLEKLAQAMGRHPTELFTPPKRKSR